MFKKSLPEQLEVLKAITAETRVDSSHLLAIGSVLEAIGEALRIENHVLMFHAQCGGIVTGEVGKPLICAECGREMTAFVASSEEASVVPAPEPTPVAVPKPKPICYKCGQPIVGGHHRNDNGPYHFRGRCPGEVQWNPEEGPATPA